MNDQRILISIAVTEDGFFTNAQLDSENFVCTTAQPNLDMSLASAMSFIRDYGEIALTRLRHRRDERAAHEASGIPGPKTTATLRGATGPSNGEALPLLNDDRTKVFISGKGWIPTLDLQCLLCGDEGRIPTGWSDEGDAENGPCLVVTDWEYCTCAIGVAESLRDERDSAAYRDFFGIPDEPDAEYAAEYMECQECSDSGFRPIGEADDWEFCSCPRGVAASAAHYAEREAAWESRTASRNR